MSEEWLSITEAAARLSEAGDVVDRSTLSRYLTQYADALPTKREGKSNLVDFAMLAAHRSENVRLRRVPAQARSKPAGNRQSKFPDTAVDGRSRKEIADAEMREMDLAERRGELTPTGEVDQAGRAAVALMQAAFDRAVEAEAATLSVRYGWDERIIRIALKGFSRRGLEMFNTEIRNRLDQMARKEFAGVEHGSIEAASVELQ